MEKLSTDEPRIAVRYDRYDPRKVITILFKPGMRIQRNGKVFEIDKNGTQRRVK